MPKLRFYHTKTLLWTYLVWVFINLLLALWCCEIAESSIIRMPYYLGLLHILPLYGLIGTLWDGDAVGIIFFLPGVIAGFAVLAGLLIRRRWARLMIIIGMSSWFFGAFCILGLGA